MAGDGSPDLVARKGGNLLVYRNSGTTRPAHRSRPGWTCRSPTRCSNAGDWDRDGFGDVINRNRDTGALFLRRGCGIGPLRPRSGSPRASKGVALLAAVGDMTGDGWLTDGPAERRRHPDLPLSRAGG